jgi:hypothetical protein
MTLTRDDSGGGRPAQIDLSSDQFRELGHRLVDRVYPLYMSQDRAIQANGLTDDR